MIEPLRRIVGQRCAARAAGELVELVVGVRAGARGAEVAAAIIAEARRPRCGLLVEPVDRVVAVDVVMPGPGVGVIALDLRLDLARRIVGDRADGLITGGARQVLRGRGEA